MAIAPGQKKDYTPIYRAYGTKGRRGVYRYAYTPGGQQAYDALGLPISISNRAYLNLPKEQRAQFTTFNALIAYIGRFARPDLYYGYIVAHGTYRDGYIALGVTAPPTDGWRNVHANEIFTYYQRLEVQGDIIEESERIFAGIDTWELGWGEI
jgi:hypothetical protein